MTARTCACGCGAAVSKTCVKGHNRRVPLRELVARNTVKTSSCWLWTGTTMKSGYGRVTLCRRPVQAHRASYEVHVGPIPNGMQIDHICHTRELDTCPGGPSCLHRRCVNPDHLRPVTQRVNILDGLSPPALNARKTHCKHGHELTGANLVTRDPGRRRCRTCLNAVQRRKRARRAAAIKSSHGTGAA